MEQVSTGSRLDIGVVRVFRSKAQLLEGEIIAR